MICETLSAAMGTSVRRSHVVNLGDSYLCTAVIADHIQGASTGMRGRRRPLRRELQQVHSEILYLRHYRGTDYFGRGLLLPTRGVDLLLKTLCSPVWKARLIVLRGQ
jgi:hypothetical protein